MEMTDKKIATLTEICDPKWADFVKREVIETDEGPKEVFKLNTNLDYEYPYWVEVSSHVMRTYTEMSQYDIDIKSVLTRMNNYMRRAEEAEEKLRQMTDIAAKHQTQATEWKNLYDDQKQKHIEDIQTIGDRLIEESNERNWCEEFDDIIEQVNQKMHIPLAPRKQDFEVTVYVTVSVSQEVTVTARNEDEALQLVKDNPMEFVDVDDALYEELRYGCPDFTVDLY